MVWGNGRLPRVCAGFGCVVFCPDTMATDEGRARHLRPLHTVSDDTDYWDNNLFYAGKKEALGESMELSTTVDDVLARSEHFKGLYERIFQLRSSELHFLLRRLPAAAKVMGVTLFGTSEGAMSISRFDDRPYGKLITSRVLNAYGGEFTYFTPTRAAADLGGQLDVPTLNIIGTRDEFFGPPATDGWEGSIASKIAADGSTGWGNAELSGNAYASYLRQGVRKGLVATFLEANHDATIDADNAVRDVLLSFLAAPLRCTECALAAPRA